MESTRRDFIRQSSLSLAAAAVAGTVFSGFAGSEQVHASEKAKKADSMNVGSKEFEPERLAVENPSIFVRSARMRGWL